MSEVAYKEACDRLGEIADIGRAAALLAWDERTKMPRGGAAPRAEHMETLARIAHERMTDDALGSLLEGAEAWAQGQPYDSDEASTVRMALRAWRKARRVPTALAAELAGAGSRAEHAWVKARAANDFAALLPHLKLLLGLKRRLIDCFDDFDHPYDVLLDDFEPEMTVAVVRPLLGDLRAGLTRLLERIPDDDGEPRDACLHGQFDVEAQRALGLALCELLPLRESGWRLDSTAHPFAVSIAPSDIRLTTRYEPDFVGSSVWSVIHESGHGLYESGMPDELRRLPIGSPNSLGLHESQSRLWENWVGRGRPFVEGRLLPLLREHFPGELAGIDAEQLYRACNTVRRSLIRTEADEVTYNLHVAIRFELEVEIFEGRLALEDLPEAWNDRYARYLGVAVPSDADGVLQDVHWPSGAFGYFPTYSLGNLIAAQLWAHAREEIPSLDEALRAGDLEVLRSWLDRRLFQLAGRFTPAETIARATGSGLAVAPLLDHLERKYGELYELAPE